MIVRPAESKYTYFVSGGELVKIGSSDYPEQRLMDLQTGSPTKLALLGVLANRGVTSEDFLHSVFAGYRRHGEWFARNDLMRQLLEMMAADRDTLLRICGWMEPKLS